MEAGELKNLAEEWIEKNNDTHWEPVPSCYKGFTTQAIEDWDLMIFRRRITSEPKQDEEKRFVTVIIEADEKRVEALVETLTGIVSIREGNALDTLDNIETNVIAAIRGAKGQP